jgi:hypothetical protein
MGAQVANDGVNEKRESCLDHPLTLSFGRGATDSRPAARTMTFGDLIKEFATPDTTRGTLAAAQYHALEKAQRDREKDGAYFVPCQFGGDGRRCNDNVEALCGIALDFDSGNTTKDDISRLLRGYAFVAYPSYSHLAELEKWRVFIPYREPIAKEQHPGVFRWFQQLFLDDVDTHCANPCQLWYTPACPPDGGHLFQGFRAVGELFDAGKVKSEAIANDGSDTCNETSPPAANQSDSLRRLKDALRFISADDRQTWVKFGIAIKHDLGDGGLLPWLEWSRTSKKFDLNEALKAWASFKDETTATKITLGSIFYLAAEHGWTDDAKAQEIPRHIARLNEHYFLAPQGGKTLIFNEAFDPLDGRRTLRTMGITDFRVLFMNEFVDSIDGNGKHKRVSVAEAWLTHPMRRQYHGVVLAPNSDVPGYYNLWQGFAIEARAGDWSLMREHIRRILCKCDDQLFQYVLSWLAYCVQQPGRPAEVALVMRGGRGVGKGMFAGAFGSLFGGHYEQISNARHLTGNFNAHLRACIVLFVDEAFWAGDKQGEAVLKHYITEPTLPIEHKGRDLARVPNLLHIIMASNSQWVVPAGLDERRFLVLDADDSMQQNVAYFKALSDELENGGRAAMLHDLLQRDLTNFNHRKAPKTTGLMEQKLLSLDPHQQWFFEKLQSGSLTGFKDDWVCVSKEKVQRNYIDSLKDSGIPRRASQTALGMHLKTMLPKPYPRSIKGTTTVDGFQVPSRCYELPPLSVCRKHFEDMLGLQGYDWEGADADNVERQPFQPL